MAKFNWKVWLRRNLLTTDVENDYIAEVSTNKNTRRNEDIARRIVEQGSELNYETILYLLNVGDKIRLELLLEGWSVMTGIAMFVPRVQGAWSGSSPKFDPVRHKRTFDAIPTGEAQKRLEEVDIDVLGIKDTGGVISLVTDTLTKKTDGTITPNDDIRIEGDKIKIAPEDEPGAGVFFVAVDGTVYPVTRILTENNPKTLIARVPALPAGEYTLRITTKFSSGNYLLKSLRTIEYAYKLTVS